MKGKIYPNPTHSTLVVSMQENGIKELYASILNFNGREVWNNMISPKDEIDIHQLAKGLYLLRLSDQNGLRRSIRFVKD